MRRARSRTSGCSRIATRSSASFWSGAVLAVGERHCCCRAGVAPPCRVLASFGQLLATDHCMMSCRPGMLAAGMQQPSTFTACVHSFPLPCRYVSKQYLDEVHRQSEPFKAFFSGYLVSRGAMSIQQPAAAVVKRGHSCAIMCLCPDGCGPGCCVQHLVWHGCAADRAFTLLLPCHRKSSARGAKRTHWSCRCKAMWRGEPAMRSGEGGRP